MARRGRLCHRRQATREGQSGRVALLECPYESRHSSRDVRGTPNVVFPSSFPHSRRVAYGQPVPVACAWLLLLTSLRRAAVDWPWIQTSRGTIVQIGSALAYRSIPLQSAYCGAKHAMVGFTDSLRRELIHHRSPRPPPVV